MSVRTDAKLCKYHLFIWSNSNLTIRTNICFLSSPHINPRLKKTENLCTEHGNRLYNIHKEIKLFLVIYPMIS